MMTLKRPWQPSKARDHSRACAIPVESNATSQQIVGKMRKTSPKDQQIGRAVSPRTVTITTTTTIIMIITTTKIT